MDTRYIWTSIWVTSLSFLKTGSFLNQLLDVVIGLYELMFQNLLNQQKKNGPTILFNPGFILGIIFKLLQKKECKKIEPNCISSLK
jgi:hypothetical protein